MSFEDVYKPMEKEVPETLARILWNRAGQEASEQMHASYERYRLTREYSVLSDSNLMALMASLTEAEKAGWRLHKIIDDRFWHAIVSHINGSVIVREWEPNEEKASTP